jgi:hypothetical protein
MLPVPDLVPDLVLVPDPVRVLDPVQVLDPVPDPLRDSGLNNFSAKFPLELIRIQL